MNLPQGASDALDRLTRLDRVTVLRDVPLSQYTRFGIGGPADVYLETADPASFGQALAIVRDSGLPSVVIGGGTNLIVADEGFRGVCLKLTSASIAADGLRVHVECGATLQALVDFTVQRGLKGLETMTGIPGSVGAAIYGNAGAYGHSIQERVRTVRFLEGEAVREFSNTECRFRYRESVFKSNKQWVILSSTLEMEAGDAAVLHETSDRILTTRNRKYPPTMRCAGSIFKNFLLADLPARVASEIPATVIIEGKVPSAWFLEQVGAKGMKQGGIEVADYHANLIYNAGGGTARDLLRIVDELKRRVRQHWDIPLEEEVQYVGFEASADFSRHAGN
jgi:UDP-N-acetylmuramate dehydrogenase